MAAVFAAIDIADEAALAAFAKAIAKRRKAIKTTATQAA